MSKDIRLQSLFPVHRGTEPLIEYVVAQRIWHIFPFFLIIIINPKKAFLGRLQYLCSSIVLAVLRRGLCSAPEEEISRLFIRLQEFLGGFRRNIGSGQLPTWWKQTLELYSLHKVSVFIQLVKDTYFPAPPCSK